MAIDLVEQDGQTPLDPDEKAGLIPEHLATKGDLNDWEQENILRAVRDLAVEHGGSEWRIVTLSAGVAAVMQAPSDDAQDALLREADGALYLAKDAGRNTAMLASLSRAMGRSTPTAA